MTPLSPILIPALLGYLTLTTFLRSTPIRCKNLFLLAASLPTGFGICSMILFVSLWVIPLHAKFASVATSIAATLTLSIFFLFRQFKDTALPSIAHDLKILPRKFLRRMPRSKEAVLKFAFRSVSFLIFLAAAWAIVQFYTLSVSTNITGGWDARYLWSLKAKFMFRSPTEWQTMFSPKLFWAHPDYPLLWPGTLTWGWNWLGQESLLWPPWASLCFYISCALVLVWYLTAYASSIAGFLGGTFFLVLTPPLFWSVHQYADVPLAFFVVTSGLTLVSALRSGQAGLLMVSGLMAGLAAWTKNEGLWFLLCTGILLGGLKILKIKKGPSAAFPSLKAFLGGACIPMFWVLALKIFLGKTGDYLGSERSAGDYLTLIFSGWERGATILQSFWNYLSNFPSWKGLWIFFFLACIVFPFKKKKNGHEGLLPVLMLLLNLGYLLAFLTTPYDLQFQIQNSLERLLIHTAPLALAFNFEILTFRQDIAEK